jgi:hypothetical protein
VGRSTSRGETSSSNSGRNPGKPDRENAIYNGNPDEYRGRRENADFKAI